MLILLRLKGVEFDLKYVDLSDPPDWFLQISPRKKVPLLKMGDQALFESVAIMEYIDEAYSPSLFPSDLIEKAKHRAWIEFSNQCMWHAFHLTVKKDRSEFEQACEDMWWDFDEIEKIIVGKYFSGNELALVDIAFAPLFQQLNQIEQLTVDINNPQRHPKLQTWRKELTQHAVINDALGEDFHERYFELIAKRGGYLSQFLDLSEYDVHSSSVY